MKKILILIIVITFLAYNFILPSFLFATSNNESVSQSEIDGYKFNYYVFALGGSLSIIAASDWLIEQKKHQEYLFYAGMATSMYSLVQVSKPGDYKKQNLIHDLAKNDWDMKLMDYSGNTALLYSIYSLSRNKGVLSLALLFGAFSMGNGIYSREKGIGGVYCLSGVMVNLLLPSDFDRNQVFLSNMILFGLTYFLYPPEKKSVEEDTWPFTIKFTPINNGAVFAYRYKL